MSEKMSEEEKSVSKIIKSNFKNTPNNILVIFIILDNII